jgi:hypothetical protein
MAVVIAINDKGEKSYKSVESGIIPANEIIIADKLNQLITQRLSNFIKGAGLKKGGKRKIQSYWEIGCIIKDILEESNLVNIKERNLFFDNVRIHLPTEFFPENDIKRKRNIPEQFYKLSKYPYSIAGKLEWSQWSYIFDNPYLMNCNEFDDWFAEILRANEIEFFEGFVRLWLEILNTLLKNIDVTFWNDREFLMSINLSINIVLDLEKSSKNIRNREERRVIQGRIKKTLNEHKRNFILILSENGDPNKFAKEIVNSLTK